ncbi:MAG: type II toxin-antitoxin system VapC family toxin [Chloroflexota bacterium]
MIVDSSAIVALILQEPDHEALASTIARAPEKGVGAPTLVECGIVLSSRLGYDARGLLARFIRAAEISIVPFTEAHFDVAIGAWLRFGKGRHPAALNFGDCLSYAVARVAEMPLLCVGDDFPQTDLRLA